MKSFILKCPDNLAELASLCASEENISALMGTTAKLAFSPQASLVRHWDDTNLDEIKKFCQNQQSKGNLLIGFLSYDLGLKIHKLEPKNKANLPLVYINSFNNWVEEENKQLIVKYRDKKFLDTIIHLAKTEKTNSEALRLVSDFKPAWDEQKYKTAFERSKEYIESGDIYQLNLSYPLMAVSDSTTGAIFAAAQRINRASMAGLFQTQDFDLVSLSPETFIRIQARHIETFPIKGTRAKRKNVSDELIIEELVSDQKERAELNMISDLLRNDLSIVCRPDSVKIKSRQNTTKLSRVIHTYSHITGELMKNISSIEALLKMFPGGSISGCPKKRALEIIDELEEYSRGPYSGTLFALEPDDSLEASILIRTLIKTGETLSLPVGGGIVYDSTLKNEYQETLDKSQSIINTFQSG